MVDLETLAKQLLGGEQYEARCNLRVLSFDPGETTGVAYFRGFRLASTEQLNTSHPDIALKAITNYCDGCPCDVVVMEDYRVYQWKLKQHSFSNLYTPRIIGMLETLCLQREWPYHKQSAQQGKGFVTDAKLESWGFYKKGQRHARDAMRHGLYFLLFPPQTITSQAITRGT